LAIYFNFLKSAKILPLTPSYYCTINPILAMSSIQDDTTSKGVVTGVANHSKYPPPQPLR